MADDHMVNLQKFSPPGPPFRPDSVPVLTVLVGDGHEDLQTSRRGELSHNELKTKSESQMVWCGRLSNNAAAWPIALTGAQSNYHESPQTIAPIAISLLRLKWYVCSDIAQFSNCPRLCFQERPARPRLNNANCRSTIKFRAQSHGQTGS